MVTRTVQELIEDHTTLAARQGGGAESSRRR